MMRVVNKTIIMLKKPVLKRNIAIKKIIVHNRIKKSRKTIKARS